mmetsp:Transcript_3884/g.9141  ORF Transcript_3884/g.9141 Transcript_3884/m.9141 type:complete len:287 (-) Transcript_3884:98-958(-)
MRFTRLLFAAIPACATSYFRGLRQSAESDASHFAVETSGPAWGESPDWMSLLEIRVVDGTQNLWEGEPGRVAQTLTPSPSTVWAESSVWEPRRDDDPEDNGGTKVTTISNGLLSLLQRGSRAPLPRRRHQSQAVVHDSDIEAIAAIDADMDVLMQRMVRNDRETRESSATDVGHDKEEWGDEGGPQEEDDGYNDDTDPAEEDSDEDEEDEESQSFVQVGNSRPSEGLSSVSEGDDEDIEDGDDVLAQLTNFDDDLVRDSEDDVSDSQGEEAFAQISSPHSFQSHHL